MKRFSLAFLCAACFVLPARADTCKASWYGFESGSRTANGEHFNPHGLSAAHRSLRFGTRVKVMYRGRSVVVRVNDRGPARWTGRCIDLSKGAAQALGMIHAGYATVSFEVVR